MIGKNVHLLGKKDNSELILKPLVEEIDQEDWKNHTINLIEELDNKEIGNAALIKDITLPHLFHVDS